MFRTRLITALVGAALMIFCLIRGICGGLFLVLALVAFYEYADMLRQKISRYCGCRAVYCSSSMGVSASG